MRKHYTTKAIILQGRNFGESDKIMVAFTKERGRVDFYARGVRKMKSKNRALVQPFTYSDLDLSEGKNMDYLNQGVLIESFANIRSDFDKIIECSYLAEYLIQVLHPQDPYVELCYQFLLTLNYMDKRKPETNIATMSFLIKSFGILGYAPLLDGCARCGKPVEKLHSYSYVASEGSLVCGDCGIQDGFKLDNQLLEYYRKLEYLDLKEDNNQLQDKVLLMKLEALIELMMTQILEREHKSSAFLKKIKKMRI
ncbi:DNA repair protein RecO [Clostridia bacterium]|nr:DNA repair protein RecO [Clostridia bacterium]